MQNHEPIWFDKKEKKSDDIKFSVFVGTPCHSDVSIHYTQSVLELQKYGRVFCLCNRLRCRLLTS